MVGGPLAACLVAAALALVVALWVSSAVRGEEEVHDNDEDEDEEEVVISGDAGCPNMRARAGLQAASASTAATLGPIAAISSICGFGAGSCKGPAAVWRPMSRCGRQRCVGEAWVCGLHRLASVLLGSCKL